MQAKNRGNDWRICSAALFISRSRDEKLPLGDEVAARIVALTLDDPPSETTHWTGALMAKVSGVSVSSVQRIWRAHGLQPHRVRQFKLSNDPKFVDKLPRCRRAICRSAYPRHCAFR